MAKAGRKHSTSPRAPRELMRIVYILKKAAADHASNQSLTTDERLLLAWQSHVLDTAVRKLVAEPALPREERIYAAWEAIGAACLLAPSLLNDRIRNKLQAALATQGKQKAYPIIREVATEELQRHHAMPPWNKLADIIEDEVNRRLDAHGLKLQTQNAIRLCLPKLNLRLPRLVDH
jgi:hypothetical protein